MIFSPTAGLYGRMSMANKHAVQHEDHKREHGRRIREAVVPPESARATLRGQRGTRVRRHGEQGRRGRTE